MKILIAVLFILWFASLRLRLKQLDDLLNCSLDRHIQAKQLAAKTRRYQRNPPVGIWKDDNF
jgi:hypothetical protein